MAIGERDLATRLLKQSILTLCREAVAFRSRLEVDGVICLTVDDQVQHVVKIHEYFDKSTELETPHSSDKSASSERRTSPSRTIIRYAPNAQTEKEIPDLSIPEMENTVIKSEPHDDTDSNQEDAARSESQQEVKPSKRTALYNLPSLDYTSMGLDKLAMSSARNIHCKKCKSFLENVSLFQVHNMTSHGQFTCLVCLSTFTSRNNMKRHIRLHTGIKPYSCHKCPESFSRNDDFKRHLLKHTFQKPFRCAICQTGYSDRACVKSHMISDHSSKVFHICPHCGETYMDLQKFQQHKKCHPEFQDYRCSLCSFTGSNALMYNKHMLTHGPLKEYKCTYCNLSYSDPFLYTGHLKRHKDDELVQTYSCCFCDISLPSFEQFQRHEHTHVHSKRHICNQCNKHFRYPSNLREHMLIHLHKSDFSGIDKSEQQEGIHHVRDGENATATSTEHGDFSSDEEMETEEENNNKIDTDKEPVGLQFPNREEISGSSEYWCAECNQGFGTESKLKKHIAYKHEGKDVGITDDEEEAANRTECLNAVKITEPLAVKAQTEIGLLDNNFTENTHSMLSNISPYDGNTSEKHQNLVVCKKNLSNSQEKWHDICGAEAVFDNMENSATLHNEAKGASISYPQDNVTETKLNTVKDAMREVKNIQFRFGIKSKGLEMSTSNMKEVKKGITVGETVADRSKSWSTPSRSNITMPIQNRGQAERSVSVSVSGMDMTIQRSIFFLNKGSDDGEGFSMAKDTYTDDKLHDECAIQKNDDKSVDCNKPPVFITGTNFSVTPNQRSATTLNLQIRNPGFERVVTPDVLFNTKAPFTCEVCEETFESFDDFHEHGVKVHRRFICSYCGKVFTSRPNRERHIRYHTGEKPYKCDLCTATFLRGDDLKYHRTTKHADVKPFICGACQTSFSLPKDLEKHLKIYSDHRL